jgi:CAAX protease family protein
LNKKSLLLLGLITLVLFPIPTFIGLYFIEGTKPLEIVQLENLTAYPLTIGISFGILYAILALGVMQARVFQELPTRVETLVKNMNLSIWDCFFLSVCAGVGEELLFRAGIQHYLGPIITSVVFVAIHGYLNPFNWRMSLYGIVVLPFILVISYAYIEYGLWFCIGAHFSYDFVLFVVMTRSSSEPDEPFEYYHRSYDIDEVFDDDDDDDDSLDLEIDNADSSSETDDSNSNVELSEDD